MKNNTYEELFFQALRIRLFEEKIIEIYPTDKIQSPVHLSIGQEAVAVGVCSQFAPEDMLFINRIKLAYGAKSDVVKIVQTDFAQTQEQLDEFYSSYMTDGYEGQMVRNNTPYENKRSNNLLKRKEFITEEFQVVSMLEGQGNWAGHVKHFALTLPNGATCGALRLRGRGGNPPATEVMPPRAGWSPLSIAALLGAHTGAGE